MGLFNKAEKQTEPQWFVSATGDKTYNYKVYYMSRQEKLLYGLGAFVVGAFVGYLFYGGLGKDADGNPTSTTWILNILVGLIVGIITVIIFLPIRTRQIQVKKQNDLKLQFRELLDALTTSIGSGHNVFDSFINAKNDMSIIYSENTSIIRELKIILNGLNNNINIETMLLDLGERSGVEDIMGFANVFDTCYRKGGNLKDVIRNTQQIITEKMEIEQEIQTMVSGKKNEQSIMMLMPIFLVGMIKLMSPDFAANFTTPAGVASTTIAVVIFFFAYKIGKKILDIKL